MQHYMAVWARQEDSLDRARDVEDKVWTGLLAYRNVVHIRPNLSWYPGVLDCAWC